MIVSRHFKLHYWPGMTCAWFILTFTTSYIISVLDGHIYPFFPYISDTGTLPPESCIFGQMLNIGAVFMGISMYIRYRQVEFAVASDDIDLSRKWNLLAFWIGNIVCVGISVVGNFQETSLLFIHCLGAFMAFGIGGFYLIIQTRITFAFRHANYKHTEFGVSRKLLYIRTVLTFSFFILLFAVVTCSSIAVKQFTGSRITWWTEEQGGFHFRLAATFSEWLMVMVFIAYTLTAAKEFKSMEYEEIRFKSKYILCSKAMI